MRTGRQPVESPSGDGDSQNGDQHRNRRTTMSAAMKSRYERATVGLIRSCTSRLVDDTRIRLVVPVRTVATATIAEMLMAKAVRA